MDEREDMDIVEESTDTFDDIELEDADELTGDKLRKLRDELKKCQSERQEHLDGWQRAQAETLNVKKRLEEEKATDRVRAQALFVEKLLPLCDSFDMAMGNTEAWEEASESWRKGIEAIRAQLSGILAAYNVTPIGKPGDAFDPQVHEAVSNEPVDDEKLHDCITNVLQNGYMMGDQLVRAAKVTVGEFRN